MAVEVIKRFEETDAIGFEDTTAIGFEGMAIDLTQKDLDVAWLFDVLTYHRSTQSMLFDVLTYHWSTQSITCAGQAYNATIDPESFDGIRISKSYNGAERIHVLEDITIEIPDAAGDFTSSDFLTEGWKHYSDIEEDEEILKANEDVHVFQWVDDGTNSGAIQEFIFTVIGAKKVYDTLYLTLQDAFIYHDLEVLYPDKDLISDIWMSDGDSNLGYCLPVPFGEPYIPLPSVYITDQRYYVLGEDTGTYTIMKTQSPESWPKSTWNGTYTYTQSTKDTDKRVFQAIIADSDNDGTADANGLFKEGSQFRPISTHYYRSDNRYKTDAGDILADLVFSGSIIEVDAGYYTKSYTDWNGAFCFKRPRYEWASEILKACNGVLTIGPTGKREVRNLVCTAYGKISSDDIVDNSFNYDPLLLTENYDGGHIRFPKEGDPQHVLYKYSVGLANTATSNPSSDTLDLCFIADDQDAQKMGALYIERVVDKKAETGCQLWVDWMTKRPDSLISVSGALYDAGTAYDVVINRVHIDRDFIVSLDCTEFNHSISEYDDLMHSELTISDGDSSGSWSYIIQGPDGSVSEGDEPNEVTTIVKLGVNGKLKTAVDPESDGGLIIENSKIHGYNSSGLKLLEMIYDGANEGDVYFGDYDNANSGLKYDHSAGKLYYRGDIYAEGGEVSWTYITDDGNKPDDGADVTGDNTANNTIYINDSENEAGYEVIIDGDLKIYNGADVYFYTDEGSSVCGKIFNCDSGLYLTNNYNSKICVIGEQMLLKASRSINVNTQEFQAVGAGGGSTTSCGTSTYKWDDIYCVTLHEGDHCMSDLTCYKCGRIFQEGDSLIYTVIKADEEEIRCVPVCLKCGGKNTIH